ncbi:MAG: hypothetical protein O2960_15925 [Verrucomicrobia bacterium]|nr:hypothetical protein [Verrucomicrobiota bacterium]
MKIAFVILACVSVPVAAAIQVTIVQPTPGQLAGDSVFVAATVTSTFEIASVTASVADRTSLLTFSSSSVPGRFGAIPGWTNTVSLNGLERGAFNITVTARDVFGAESSSQTSFTLDRRPVLRITAPLQDTVTKSSVPVDFSFSDDGPTLATIRILAGSTLLATNPVTSLNLSAFDHSSVTLRFEITDSEGQTTTDQRTVFIESNPRLRAIGPAPPPDDLKVKIEGDWIAYHDGGIWAGLSNTVTRVAYGIQSDGPRTLALTTDGTLYTDPVRYFSQERGWFYAVMKLKDGVVSPVMDEVKGRKIETEFISNFAPFWDGQHVLYIKRDPERGYALILLANGVETMIAGWNDSMPAFTALNGWVAYTQKGTSGQDQIWMRAPDGSKAQRTFFGSSSRIEVLNPSGELMLSNAGVKHLSQPGKPLLELSAFIGQPAWSGDHWSVTIGSTLFRLDPADVIQSISIRNGQAMISLRTVNTGPVEIQASTDLENWQTLATVPPSEGVVEFSDQGSVGLLLRFYRTVSQ